MLSSWVVVLTWLASLKMFSVAQDSALEEAWRDWKTTYGKVYAEVSLFWFSKRRMSNSCFSNSKASGVALDSSSSSSFLLLAFFLLFLLLLLLLF